MDVKNKPDDQSHRIASLSMFRNIMDYSTDSIYFKDQNYQFVAVNKNKADRHGFANSSEMNGKTDFDFLSKIDAQRIHDLEKEVFESGRPTIGKVEKLSYLDGSDTWVSSSTYPIYDEDQKIVGIWGISRDVTNHELTSNSLRESEERYRQLSEQSRTFTWEMNDQGLFTYIDRVAELVLGYHSNELVNVQYFFSLIPDENREMVKRTAFDIFTKKDSFRNFEMEALSKEGRTVWLSVNGVPMLNADGTLSGYRGSNTDITAGKQVEIALKESENRLIAAQAMAHVGNWELDLKTNLVWASKESFKIYGIEQKSSILPLELVKEAVCSEYRKTLNDKLINLITNNAEYDIEFEIKKMNTGATTHVHSIAVLSFDQFGSAAKVIGTIQDITERKIEEKKIIYLSYHDQLTGLYNRRFYEEELNRLDTRRNLPLSIVMGDVNGLKLINDCFGHVKGDELLKKIAEVIQKGCRADDIISRYGGDEFVIILPKTNTSEANRIVQRINDLSLKEKVGSIDISISFGHETKNHFDESIQDVFKRAEDNMYRHKFSERSKMNSEQINIIMNQLYEKNHREQLHSIRVSQICQDIASKMNLDKDEISKVRIAGLMHDIGKIEIDEKILNKPQKLNQYEWAEIMRHPEIGYRILSSVSEFSTIAEIVLAHQERWDGKGYPRGLAGEEIILLSRIIAIADSFDAMTSNRAFNDAVSEADAINEIQRCSGSQFDPEIARIFVEKVLGKEWDETHQ